MYTLSVVENDDVDVYYYEPECFDDMQNAIIKFEAIGCECSYYFEHNEQKNVIHAVNNLTRKLVSIQQITGRLDYKGLSGNFNFNDTENEK